jgi:hypothetical protein
MLALKLDHGPKLFNQECFVKPKHQNKSVCVVVCSNQSNKYLLAIKVVLNKKNTNPFKNIHGNHLKKNLF